MSDVGRGAGLGFGLILGIVVGLVAIPMLGTLFLCGGCATVVGTGVGVAPAPELPATPPVRQSSVDEGEAAPAADGPVAGGEVPPGEFPELPGGFGEAEPATVRDEAEGPPTVVRPDVPRPVITIEEYERLENGMTLEQAVRVVGPPPEELSRGRLGGVVTLLVMWRNADGSNANVTFRNDVLVQRAQFGLPSEAAIVAATAAQPPPKPPAPGPAPAPPPGKPATAAEAGQVLVERRRLEADRAAAEKQAREDAAAADLSAVLADVPDLSTGEAIGRFREAVVAAGGRHPGTGAAKKAEREAAGLGTLRLALLAGERGLDVAGRLRDISERYPGTAAAKAAAGMAEGR